jgi:hypothetical protein
VRRRLDRVGFRNQLQSLFGLRNVGCGWLGSIFLPQPIANRIYINFRPAFQSVIE